MAFTARRAALVCALHRRKVGVSTDVVRGQNEIGDRCRCLRPQPPRVGVVNQERLDIGIPAGMDRVIHDVRVKEPVMQILVAEEFGAAHIQTAFELKPDLVGNLLTRAVKCRLAVEPGRIPLRDVDREDSAGSTVAPLSEIDFGPELPLRNGGQRPRAVDKDDVAMSDRHITRQIELYPVHPLHAVRQWREVRQRADRAPSSPG